MKLRSSLLLVPVVAGLAFGTLAPAQAVATEPVTDLSVNVVQAPGSHDSWKVTASWTSNGATSYNVVIADQADGSVTDGAYYGNKSTSGSPVSLTTDKLADGADYWVAVHVAGETAPAVAQFHTGTLDTVAPTGTYKLDKTSAYLMTDLLSDEQGSATFKITQTSVEAGATRKVVAGDGSAAKVWASGTGYMLSYTKAGTYTPHVQLTDQFGNVNDIKLASVRVLADTVAPVIRISTPAKAGKAASWRRIRGTATDTGTGIAIMGVAVLEKRGSVWWVYDFDKHKWLKGETSLRKTESKSKASPAILTPASSGAWRTPAVKGLQKGTIRVEAIAIDNEFNVAEARPVSHRIR